MVECLEEEKYTYTYKGEVEIPPLGMVDDLICISQCGHKTAMMNAFINFKTNSKSCSLGLKSVKNYMWDICMRSLNARTCQ